MSRSSLDVALVFLTVLALLAALLMNRAVAAPHRINRPVSDEAIELGGALLVALLASVLLTGDFVNLLPVLAAFLCAAALLRYRVRRLNMPGIIWVTAELMGFMVASLWGWRFVVESGFPVWVERMALSGLGLSWAVFAIGLAGRIAREAVLTHELWQLPVAAPAPFSGKRHYKVSLHLPCYAEPPEVVKETMNRIAALEYDNFEVLVCDNNTRDERLWQPLEEHCAVLNRRLGRELFRFFHVAPLPGAKAGALNFCLEQMACDTEIVGVIDADYISRPDFLSRLTAFFDDPGIGYVQTPHDYRDYAGSRYLAACYWEYMPNNKVEMPGVSEYDGAFTIGTMCLLRADALRRIGGWAEWCLTEDSEVSVRLRAAGYRGIYLGETFGRGLIPETFDDFKKQRFRWTAGPVQQLRRHWRLFLPSPFAAPMPGWTKLLEVLRCVAPLQRLLGLMAGLFGAVTVALAIGTEAMRPIDIPDVSWLLLALAFATWWVRTRHRYRLAGCNRAAEVVFGEIARMSLTYIVLVAGVAGLSSRPLAWRRTPKFALQSTEPSPFASTLPESLLGAGCAVLAIVMLSLGGVLGTEFCLMSAMGLGALGFRFFCAPYMAALGIAHGRERIGILDNPVIPLTQLTPHGHALPEAL